MSKNVILISMPVYNAEATLANAIQSILDQKHSKFILNIVDDCSTDNSLAIAQSFLSDPRVRLFKNKVNMGAYYCRNYGLYVSRNDDWAFFTTHDADDISFPERYKAIVRKFSSSDKIGAIQDTFERIDTVTGRTLSAKTTMAHAVFRKEAFTQIGYFDNVRFGGDWEHWNRLKMFYHTFETGQKTISIDKTLGESYIHDSNLTVLIPETSAKRHKYVQRATKKMSRMKSPAHFYFGFEPEKGYTRRIL